ncbi:LemA family protein [Wohlfahrtiimonas larvae]|uniref:LemA family protein n=2 Tax=Wohlfahrtiimonas larvae TaxID=1157986 RepID=A0ABP9N3Z0_9GAMM
MGMVSIYNQLIKHQQMSKEAFAGMDVFLKKRYDLIPMLVSVTKGARDYEANVLKEIVELRSQGLNGNLSVGDLGKNELKLSDRISQLLVLVENYPEIKANQSFKQLHESLVKVEDDISKARRYYNATVRHYLTYKQQFPNVIIASMFHFPMIEYFAVDDSTERNAPTVSL